MRISRLTITKLSNLEYSLGFVLEIGTLYCRKILLYFQENRPNVRQLSLTNRATHLCKCNGVNDLKHASNHCVTMPNLVVLR